VEYLFLVMVLGTLVPDAFSAQTKRNYSWSRREMSIAGEGWDPFRLADVLHLLFRNLKIKKQIRGLVEWQKGSSKKVLQFLV